MLNNCGPISSSSCTDLKSRVKIRDAKPWDEIQATLRGSQRDRAAPVLSMRGTCSHR
jgi:hypothetical protein